MADLYETEYFHAVQLSQIKTNPFELIQNQGMLLTAGDPEQANSMMINWGFMGVVWNKPVVEVFVRQQRHTKGFIDAQRHFSLSLFDRDQRDKMIYFGTNSGRDTDKLDETGFHLENYWGTPYIRESQLVLICRKLYADRFHPENFLDPILADEIAANADFHTRYIAEIEIVLQRKSK